MAIYQGGIDQLTALFGLNLRQSAVRDISLAQTEQETARTIYVTRRLALLLGLLGFLFTLAAAPLLSYFSFGNYSHSLQFALLSPLPLLMCLRDAEQAVMQGTERLKILARSNLWPTIAAVLITIPLIYFFRLKAIIPVILIYALCFWGASYLLRVRTAVKAPSMSIAELFRTGKPMLSLGLCMTIAAFANLAMAFAFTSWLNRDFSTSTVGVFRGGFTMLNTYVGVIFSAIALEFYPRLTRNISHLRATSTVVAHESTVSIAVLLPLIAGMACCCDFVVDLLFTGQYRAMTPYVSLAMAAMPARALSWCMAYTILARGKGATYVVTELLSESVALALNIIFFRQMGFAGLGIAYILWYVFYVGLISVVYFRAGFRLPGRLWVLCLLSGLFGLGCYWFSRAAGQWVSLAVMLPAALTACVILIRKKR